jgi:hypothetical protein
VNKLVTIIALTLLLKPVLPVVGYILNYDYIVNELCENRDNRALKCNGKCQLKKELAKASADTESNTRDRKLKVAEQEILYLSAIEDFLFANKIAAALKIKDSYTNFYRYNTANSIFRPPLVY